jgi:hypothetical protein
MKSFRQFLTRNKNLSPERVGSGYSLPVYR